MPASSADPITLVTLADERYALALAAMVRSLCDNSRSSRRLAIYVVDGGITPDTRRRLVASWDRERLRVEFVPPQFGDERALPVWGRLPPLTYVRVFLPRLVPGECRKAIFLDSDIVVRRDIEALWEVELGEDSLLAVQDPAVPFVSSRDGLARYAQLGIPSSHPYFNAGVMVANLDRWRDADVSERVMSFIRQHADELNYCDQDGLNAILWKAWRPIDARWHVQPRFTHRRLPLPHLDANQRTQLCDDPWIVHFSGRLKPWLYRGATLSDRVFYEYLDRTSWRGWRPRHSVKAWMYQLYDSPVRDWCYPVEQRGHQLARKLSRYRAPVESSASTEAFRLWQASTAATPSANRGARRE
jgi:lipopolysaccharide biosynthesis glycosyltransferase